MCECSICLNSVRFTRQSKRLDCGHLYHASCIDGWLATGGTTCPMCRSRVQPTFRMTISIENTSTQQIATDEITDEDVIEHLLSRFNIEQGASSELAFNIDNLEELYQIISDFGILRRVDIDALILDTE